MRQPPGTHEARTRRLSLRKRLQAQARRDGWEPDPSPLPDREVPSPLADYLTAPGPDTQRALEVAAAHGRLTTADMMAAFVAELGIMVDAMAARTGSDFERFRQAAVLRHRLLAALVKTIKPVPGVGAVQRISVDWPAHYTEPTGAGEPGGGTPRFEDGPGRGSPAGSPDAGFFPGGLFCERRSRIGASAPWPHGRPAPTRSAGRAPWPLCSSRRAGA